MSHLAYPQYSESGFDWLGPIPTSWACAPLWAVATCNDDVLPESTALDKEIHYVEISGVTAGRGITEGTDLVFSAAPSRARRRVQDGDVLVSTVRTYLRAIASVISPPGNMVVSTGFAVLRPRKIDAKYLGYAVQAEYLISEIIARSVGVSYPAINARDLIRIAIPVPSFPEQTAIAAFVDRETGKIDALVEEQKRLIELLKEKRQAVISHAVTKGLNPNAPMKASGVEWLGEVPEHWEVSPLMRLTAPGRNIMYGIVLPGPDVEDGVPIVKGGDVKPHRLRIDLLNRTTQDIEAPFARARLRPNDIVYSIRGTIGDAELVPEQLLDANITQDVARVSPMSVLNHRWLLYALKSSSVFVQLEQRSLGAAIRGINIFDLKRARIPLPTKLEQDAIAAFIDDQILCIDQLIRASLSAVKLLSERRSALISAAVTGKIDVRNGARPQEEAE